MVRSELVARIAGQNPHLFARDVEAVVDTILDAVTAALADGNRGELRGFGSFSVKKTEARISRNPGSGASVAVPARAQIHFKPSRLTQVRLNRAKIELE